MSNHGFDDSALPKEFKGLFDKVKISPQDAMHLIYPDREQIGTTGRFPMGKLTPDDEGEIRFALAADPCTKTIILDFGKPVAWLALPREDAKNLAELILERLRELE